MSTDDSISEDASTSGALSHCHASADGDVGKESETSLVSSEGTSASGLAVSEDRHTTSQTTGGTVESRPMDITPACNKIRSLCLSTEEAFEQGKSLPFINPSSLETLRALVQEIQSSGETDPEIWKDCEGRWLHLFQLVEKQYQEQILAQQEQYQCQIQVEPPGQPPATHRVLSNFNDQNYPKQKGLYFPPISSGCTFSKNVASDNNSLAAPALTTFSSPSPPLQRSQTANQEGERATTVLSSGYGTLSAWDTALEPAGSPGEDEDGVQGRDKHHSSLNFIEYTETTLIGGQQDFTHVMALGVDETNPSLYQQNNSGTSQPLTSWAQRQKLRPKKSKAEQASSQILEYQEQLHREAHKQIPLESSDFQEQFQQQQSSGLSSSFFPLRRSDSLLSEASGSLIGVCMRVNSITLYPTASTATPSQEPRLSLKEIYNNKQRTDGKRSDWEGSVTSSPSSPQVLDPAANQRQSDRTSGFTSPSHFSSPSFAAQPHVYPRVGTPVTPDSMVVGSPSPGDTDCISDTSSVSAGGPSPSHQQNPWGNVSQAVLFPSQDQTQPCSHTSSQQCRTSAPLASEEEGSNTHTSTLKPHSAAGASLRPPHMERASSLEDPVNLREKHSRHVADLKAYYESEIQILRDKLKLRDLPQDLERSNQALAERCRHLEKALAEATSRIQELEATNSLLEKKLAEWPERYAVAAATVKSLQQRMEESKRSGKEKDASAARLKSHVRQLEEKLLKTCREAEEREARKERESNMLQDLLGQYDSLVKEHEGLKGNLVATENKLDDATDQISDLKRVISKLESQVKQLEHENQARARYSSHNNTQPSGAGLLHHPDLLMSPSKGKAEPDVTRRKSPSEQPNSGRKSPFLQTNQSSIHKKSHYPFNDPSSELEALWRALQLGGAGGAESAGVRPQGGVLRPDAHDEGPDRAGGDQSHREPGPLGRQSEDHCGVCGAETQRGAADREGGGKSGGAARAEPGGGRGGGGGGGRGGVAKKRAAALLRAQRSLSPDGHRSSSLPPEHRNKPTTTPTKRGTLLMPRSAKSSPKRCPSENYSTAFGHLMPREAQMHKRTDDEVDQRHDSFHNGSPRKRLQFSSADREDDLQQCSGSGNPLEGNPSWAGRGRGSLDSCENSPPFLLDRFHSLTEAEKLLDELTQEKLQVEAALSRMPGAGGRVTLQTRLDEVALENRLERLNRQLGSLRMTLKRFHFSTRRELHWNYNIVVAQ
ncbi:hypothetical protein F7725_015742 [Dissostichus mawsoni]|uniref:M-phase phosphoprotein 9 n=1 Tax=Dissostichus mawsoni TaxID=36200 RepID=A0A7J5YIG6_DISMA|nr:hypothetical protein F7725_015742 [Dissostichus mawsoni]